MGVGSDGSGVSVGVWVGFGVFDGFWVNLRVGVGSGVFVSGGGVVDVGV